MRDVHADKSERLLEIVKKNVINLRKANRTKDKEVAEKIGVGWEVGSTIATLLGSQATTTRNS